MRDYSYQEIKLDAEPFFSEISVVPGSTQPSVEEDQSIKNKDAPLDGENIDQLTTKDINGFKITEVILHPTEFIMEIIETTTYFL